MAERWEGIKYDLLRRAEELLESENLDEFSTNDVTKLIHDLRVHQIELELQNEEIRLAHIELEESRSNYADLYDFAPVGYFTLNEKNVILEANLTGAALLGIERKYLINKGFSHYIPKENQDTFYSYRKRLVETKSPQSCELNILKDDGRSFHAELKGTAVFDSGENLSQYRLAVLDITQRKRGEIIVQENLAQLSKMKRYESIINSITQSVHRSIDLKEVMENAVKALSESIEDTDFVSIYMVEGEEAVLMSHKGYPDQYLERAGRIPHGRGATWKTILEGKIRYVPDVDHDEVIGPAGRDIGTKSYLSTPICFEGKAIGALNINSLNKDAFDEEELKLLEIVAKQIEIAISNARQAEYLRVSREKYRHLFENVPVGIYRTTPEGRIIMANPALVKILGYSAFDELASHNLEDEEFSAKYSRPKFKEVMEREGEVRGLESVWIKKDGSSIHVSENAKAIRAEEGAILYYEGTVEDVTERKCAEDDLREANDKIEMILESITDQFFAFSKDWRITYLNKQAEEQMKVLGKDPAGLIGKVLWEEFPHVPNEEAVRRVMAERVAITDELYYPPLGEWVENHMYPSPGGGMVTVQKYITDRKEAEDVLRRSEEYLAEAQRLSHTGSWAWNVSTGELFWSEEHFLIFGLDPEKAKPSYQVFFPMVHPEDQPFVKKSFDQAVLERRDYDANYRIVRPDGTIRHVRSLGHPVFNELGDLTEYVGTVIDTTERKRSEEALRKAYEEIKTLKDQLAQEKLYLEEEIRTEQGFDEIIGESAALKHILKQVGTVAPTDSTVLIQGETGTGKELIARAIHNLSRRRERTFVKINCAAIPTGLLESELFGHERGAFTGAIAQRIGRFELANGGTIFLDEVSEIPLELQAKLLRVLQEHEFERLGSTRTIRVDVRLVAASNRDLAQMVAQREFRDDLYYRLKVFPIMVPALRERVEDIPSLVRFFTQRHSRDLKKRITNIQADTMNALSRYGWPGNIRELENFIERCVILSPNESLEVPLTELRPAYGEPKAPTTLGDAERDHILRALEECGWVIAGPSGAARRLGLKRTSLQYKMQKLGIVRRQ